MKLFILKLCVFIFCISCTKGRIIEKWKVDPEEERYTVCQGSLSGYVCREVRESTHTKYYFRVDTVKRKLRVSYEEYSSYELGDMFKLKFYDDYGRGEL